MRQLRQGGRQRRLLLDRRRGAPVARGRVRPEGRSPFKEGDRAVIGKITGFSWNNGSGIAAVKFADGSRALVESGFGLGQFAAVLGTVEGAVGQEIEYDVDEFGIISQFSLPEESE